MRALSLVLLSVLSSSSVAFAVQKQKGSEQQTKGKGTPVVKKGKGAETPPRGVVMKRMKQQNNLFGQQGQRRISALEEAEQMELPRGFVGRLVAETNAQRRQMVRSRGSRFADIVAGRAKGEVILHRDSDVTAFLDWSDPKHPMFRPGMETEEDLESVPESKRAHILVVPNAPREHIGRKLGWGVEMSDMQATMKVMQSAQALAQRLGIKNPSIYVSDSNNVMIGYLHVHIVGEKGPEYPASVR